MYNLSMTNRRRSQAQPARDRNDHSRARRKLPTALHIVPRQLMSAVDAAREPILPDGKPAVLSYLDIPPAIALLAGVAIIAMVCVIYLSQVTAVTNANYTVQALQQEHTTLLREQQDLQLAIGRAQSLPNIEKVARDTLHMVPIGDKYSYLPIADGPISSVPPAPTPGLPDENAGQALP